jgi:GntR family transcriptional regulator
LLQIDRFSRTPIYEQVISQIEEMIARGIFSAGDLLPSVRNLSQELNVNPNTLQKAYSELERKGLCLSAPGSGRFIAKDAKRILLESKKDRLAELEQLVRELKEAGIGYEEIMKRIKSAFED